MAAEYKLNYSGEQINERLSKIDNLLPKTNGIATELKVTGQFLHTTCVPNIGWVENKLKKYVGTTGTSVQEPLTGNLNISNTVSIIDEQSSRAVFTYDLANYGGYTPSRSAGKDSGVAGGEGIYFNELTEFSPISSVDFYAQPSDPTIRTTLMLNELSGTVRYSIPKYKFGNLNFIPTQLLGSPYQKTAAETGNSAQRALVGYGYGIRDVEFIDIAQDDSRDKLFTDAYGIDENDSSSAFPGVKIQNASAGIASFAQGVNDEELIVRPAKKYPTDKSKFYIIRLGTEYANNRPTPIIRKVARAAHSINGYNIDDAYFYGVDSSLSGLTANTFVLDPIQKIENASKAPSVASGNAVRLVLGSNTPSEDEPDVTKRANYVDLVRYGDIHFYNATNTTAQISSNDLTASDTTRSTETPRVKLSIKGQGELQLVLPGKNLIRHYGIEDVFARRETGHYGGTESEDKTHTKIQLGIGLDGEHKTYDVVGFGDINMSASAETVDNAIRANNAIKLQIRGSNLSEGNGMTKDTVLLARAGSCLAHYDISDANWTVAETATIQGNSSSKDDGHRGLKITLGSDLNANNNYIPRTFEVFERGDFRWGQHSSYSTASVDAVNLPLKLAIGDLGEKSFVQPNHTLEGYGITDAYNAAQIQKLINRGGWITSYGVDQSGVIETAVPNTLTSEYSRFDLVLADTAEAPTDANGKAAALTDRPTIILTLPKVLRAEKYCDVYGNVLLEVENSKAHLTGHADEALKLVEHAADGTHTTSACKTDIGYVSYFENGVPKTYKGTISNRAYTEEKLTFKKSAASSVEFDGSSAKTITFAEVGALPESTTINDSVFDAANKKYTVTANNIPATGYKPNDKYALKRFDGVDKSSTTTVQSDSTVDSTATLLTIINNLAARLATLEELLEGTDTNKITGASETFTIQSVSI